MTAPMPDNPAGAYAPLERLTGADRARLIDQIAAAPAALRSATAGLSDALLETVYRNWTIRQIVHHIADSHVNSYIRFKWALTEDRPTIKDYDEGRWVALPDSRHGDIAPALALLEGLHARWVPLLRSMTPEQFDRTFVHPATGQTIALRDALQYYVWHGQHHTAQIRALRERKGM